VHASAEEAGAAAGESQAIAYFFFSPELPFFFLSKLCQYIEDSMKTDHAALFSYLTIQMHQHLLFSHSVLPESSHLIV